MSYSPKYCSISDIERLVQFPISVETKPSEDEVLEIIRSVESEVDAKKLGWKDGGSYGDGYEMTDLYIDVPPVESKTKPTPLERMQGLGAKTVILVNYPILEITDHKIYCRKNDLKDAPSWITLNEGYYPGWEGGSSDFMLIMSEGKDGQRYGIGFYFYGDTIPQAGKARLKVSFKYSYNIPQYILREYVSLKVAIEVLKLAVASGEPTRIAAWTGGDFQDFVNVQLAEQISHWEKRIREIEEQHFPDKPVGKVSF